MVEVNLPFPAFADPCLQGLEACPEWSWEGRVLSHTALSSLSLLLWGAQQAQGCSQGRAYALLVP